MEQLKSILYIDNPLVYVVLVFITIDIVTGIIKATKNHSLKSAILRNGGYKKYLIVFLILSAWALDKIFFAKDVLYTATATYYILNEVISILENLATLGVPIPNKLRSTLVSLQNETEKEKK